MKKLIFLIAMVASVLFTAAQDNSIDALIKQLDGTTPKALEQNKVPGLAIAIIKDGNVMLKKGYGYADVAQGKEIDAKTGFNIGSISKMFTAWGIMKLVEDGKIVLDDPASKYLSTWKFPKSDFNANKITIRHLLQHTAGLSVHGYSGYENKAELTSIAGSLSGKSSADEAVQLISEPGSQWKYSGGGYSVLQLIIEEVSGQSFADYMQKSVFKPLKMKHTSFTINKRVVKKSAKAYDENAKEIPLRLFNAQAAAGLHTTLEDLILFATASFSNNPVLSKESIAALTTPTDLSKGNYGMGYMVMNRFGNFTLTGHGGSNEGWESGFMLDFESKSGIIILTNGSAGKRVLFGCLKSWAAWHAKYQ